MGLGSLSDAVTVSVGFLEFASCLVDTLDTLDSLDSLTIQPNWIWEQMLITEFGFRSASASQELGFSSSINSNDLNIRMANSDWGQSLIGWG